MVDIPSVEYWTNNVEARFVICFRTSFEKKLFLKKYRMSEEFRIDYYVYSKCRVYDIHHTNMLSCHALRNYDDTDILGKIFNGEIPF